MKRIILILLVIIPSISFLFAQEDPIIKQQRIEALKVAFISQKLDLTPAEAEKFWPVYYRYENELKDVRRESEKIDVIEKDERLLNIRKKYKSEFSTLIGSNRVNNLYKSESEFRAVLLRHIQHQTPLRPGVNLPSNKGLLRNRR